MFQQKVIFPAAEFHSSLQGICTKKISDPLEYLLNGFSQQKSLPILTENIIVML
jgi:hypothetical protein